MEVLLEKYCLDLNKMNKILRGQPFFLRIFVILRQILGKNRENTYEKNYLYRVCSLYLDICCKHINTVIKKITKEIEDEKKRKITKKEEKLKKKQTSPNKKEEKNKEVNKGEEKIKTQNGLYKFKFNDEERFCEIADKIFINPNDEIVLNWHKFSDI